MNRFAEAQSPDTMQVASGLSFLLFSAPGCGVCDALKLKLPRWAEQQGYTAQFLWLDLTRFPEASSRFQVLTVPTLIVQLDGQELIRQLRHINLSLLQDALARPLALWSDP